MSSQPQYFFKTGHCRDLSHAEFATLTGGELPDNYTKDFIFSNKRLNIARTGSLVFGGVILYTIPDYDSSKQAELHEVLTDSITIARLNGKFKKLGITGPGKYLNGLLPLAKEAGAKKVNILKEQLPNFGHWKSTNDWLLLIPQGKDLHVAEITAYADQQFWAQMDMRLPHGDMQRGIINLKLARALLNLTDKKTVWDPFCGQGRVVCAGLDLKHKFYATDKDEVCVPDVQANVEYATQQLSKRHKKLGTLEDTFALDARELTDTYFLPQMNRAHTLSDLAIVTEGTLGHNFTAHPTEKDARQELVQIKKLWQTTLQQAHEAHISELIFCLPFYNFKRKKIVPEFLDELLEGTDYKYTQLAAKQNYILYTREKSHVGHMVLKVTC